MDAFFDWLGREGGILISWWLLALLAGLAAFPLSFKLLGGLPDRGYAVARSLGLLLVGFVFWLAASLGFLRNTNGSIMLAWIVVLAGSLALAWPDRRQLLAWMRENWTYIVATEALFAVLFLGWALVRAENPSLVGTEKPMEIAFMSGARRSEIFPPNDPWMSGYAISYYYFGYVMAAMLANLSAASSGAAFNLMIALLFALTGTGVFGVVYNLIRGRTRLTDAEDAPKPRATRAVAMTFGLLGVVFVLLLGNLQLVAVEIPYWNGTASPDYLAFTGTQERDSYPENFSPRPAIATWENWWWFRASRVVQDNDLSGQRSQFAQPIDEFPAFSFVLADMHPHVLALPFAVLALALALNVLFTGHDPTTPEMLLYGLCAGGLIFLNTWDGPIYMALLLGADALRRLLRNGGRLLLRQDGWPLVRFGLILVVTTLVFYAPFFISFRSQARGILPNVIFPTRLPQMLLMFGPFLILVGWFLLHEARRNRASLNWALAWRVIGLVALLAVAFILLFGLVVWASGEARTVVFSVVETAGGLAALIPEVLLVRLGGLPTTLLLGAIILLVLARLFPPAHKASQDGAFTAYSPARGFVLLMIGAGAVLTLSPDYFYLWDNFSVRINTLFKFYYQAWLIWGVASAYVAYTLLADANRAQRLASWTRYAFGAALALLLVAGLSYTVAALYSRMAVENASPVLTVDGGPSLVDGNVDEYAAIQCLNDLVQGGDSVVTEAVGGPYNHHYGRVAALTGIPNVLGWENHERQWRGSTYDAVAGTRGSNPANVIPGRDGVSFGDVAFLYNTPDWTRAEEIIRRYGIDYIFVGTTELRDYDPLGILKFGQYLTPVCQRGSVVVYQTADLVSKS